MTTNDEELGLDWKLVQRFGNWEVWTPDDTGACIGSGATRREALTSAGLNLTEAAQGIIRSLGKISIAVAFLCAVAAQAQFVQLWPTNSTLEVLVENNLGKWTSSWAPESRDRIELGARVLTFTHTVYFDGTAFMGTRGGGPKLLEDVYRFRQIGAAAYTPLGGENVTFFAPRANGQGWIAATNIVSPLDMEPLVFWLPGFVGTVTIGDRYAHTVITGSSLQMWGRNIGAGPYLLRVPCTGQGGIGFSFFHRFNRDERKLVTLGVNQVQSIFAQNQIYNAGVHWFSFDLENLPEDQAL